MGCRCRFRRWQGSAPEVRREAGVGVGVGVGAVCVCVLCQGVPSGQWWCEVASRVSHQGDGTGREPKLTLFSPVNFTQVMEMQGKPVRAVNEVMDEDLRKKLAFAIRQGVPLIIAMQQSVTDFATKVRSEGHTYGECPGSP